MIVNNKFKFQAQDIFLEYFFFEIWRLKNQIALSEKKPPLVCIIPIWFAEIFMSEIQKL